jgi:hypothetical protein
MPVNTGDSAADGLLQVLRHPPVVLLFEVAYSDEAVARADGEFGLIGRPTNKSSSAVDAEKNEGGLVAGR